MITEMFNDEIFLTEKAWGKVMQTINILFLRFISHSVPPGVFPMVGKNLHTKSDIFSLSGLIFNSSSSLFFISLSQSASCLL